MLENIVAIELLRSGYEVCGLHRSALQKEIDFVVKEHPLFSFFRLP